MAVSARRQQIVYTAVPRGFGPVGSAPNVRVAVHVSPRLSYAGDGGTLASFPDWLAWPGKSVTWRVEWNGSVITPTVVSATPDVALWQALFRSTLTVGSFTGAPGPARTVGGYSFDTLAGNLANAYTEPLGFGRSAFADSARRAMLNTRWQAGADHTTDLDAAIEHYLGFWSADQTDDRRSGSLDADFHDRLSLIGDHGPLLERLGLVVVLQIPTITAPRATSIKVTGSFAAATEVQTVLVSPLTRTIYDPANQIFAAQRRVTADAEHTERLHLNVANPAFSVHDLHVDAATAGSIGMAMGNDNDTTAAPTSGGLVLALAGRMKRVQTDLTNAEATATATVSTPATPPDRFAEDLVVGHHIEVGVGENPQWFGLGHRQVEYVVQPASGPALSFTAVDEAAVTAVARQATKDDPSQLLISDVVMRWDGWSLAVPRPGAIPLQSDPATTSVDYEQGRPPETPLTLNTDLTDTSAAGGDGRLPTLRYGQLYSIRGRAVDVTGGAPAWAGAPETPSKPYLRYDPAPGPVVLPPPPSSLTRGESARTLIVRSDPHGSPAQASTVKSSRTLVPPRSTVDTALLHGWLDGPGTGAPSTDPATWTLFTDLDSVVFPKEGPAPTGATREPAPMVVTWLPDPMSTRVHIALLDPSGDEADSEVAGFVPPIDRSGVGRGSLGSWQSVGLVVQGLASGAAPTLSMADVETPHRVVTVGLPPGFSRRVALRPSPRSQLLPAHGLVAWDVGVTDEEKADRVAAGLVPQLTPTTYVDVVHAVRRPLVDPVVGPTAPSVIVARDAGVKDPTLTIPVKVHADTSSRVSVYATWVEKVDDGPRLVKEGIKKPTTRTVARSRIAEATLDVDHANALASISLAGVVPLTDLRRVDLKLTAVATSRFVPEFRQKLAMTLPGGSQTLPTGVDPESVVVLRNQAPLALDVDYTLTSSSGTWLLTLVGNKNPAGVEVEGVNGTVLATSTSLSGVVIPSAVRPEPPKVLYAVPAFEPDRPKKDKKGVIRGGRGASRLRIYLERPWWSSGTGEQLAVIVQTGTDLTNDFDGISPAAKLVSLYGADPALKPGKYPLQKQDLMSGDLVTGTLSETTVPGSTTFIARGHEVLYDDTRDLYYTEIQLRPQPAGTFVRLAVARYQPKVATNVPKLSRIVTMDPVQILPPREFSVQRRKKGSDDKVVVQVEGAVHGGPIKAKAPIIKVSIQVKAVQGAGDDLGWDTVSVRTAQPKSNGAGYEAAIINVPHGTPSGARVLIEEIETWVAEPKRTEPREPLPIGKQPTTFEEAKLDLQARRITWVATTPLPKG